MSVSDIFSLSFLCCLGISLLLIGLISIYFNNKIMEQEHKLSAMFEIVTTMADQIHFLRTSRGVGSSMQEGGSNSSSNSLEKSECVLEQTDFNCCPTNYMPFSNTNPNLISVSDGEEEDTDEESSSDSSSESSDESNTEDNIDFEEIEEEEPKEPKEIEEIKVIKMDSDAILNSDDLKMIDISELSEEKVIDDSNETDYKKMSLGKLREIVSKKGIDASKLKKNELLKLLSTTSL